jgi:ubiquinone/menaquinone biosynthesis C-methylase UbiE
MDPSAYDAWYTSPRGGWIGEVETSLVLRLLACGDGDSILDVGCGTGYFSRRLAQVGFRVTGVDVDAHALEFAARKNGRIRWLRADARELPFGNRSFDCVVAVTSLCFIEPAGAALHEMWRVARRSVVLGLLNRNSLLWLEKRNAASYQGARWDTPRVARSWARQLQPAVSVRSAVFGTGGGIAARGLEKILPNRLSCGGFLALAFNHRST